MSCKHRSIEIISPDEVYSIVRCVDCKEIISEWTHEHLQERFTSVFGSLNVESSIFTSSLKSDSTEFLRELTDEERVELR